MAAVAAALTSAFSKCKYKRHVKNIERQEAHYTRTFSATSLHKKQAVGHLFALWQVEHLEGSGEEQSSPSSSLLRTCSASSSSVYGRKNAFRSCRVFFA
jgi:hypothetical protein